VEKKFFINIVPGVNPYGNLVKTGAWSAFGIILQILCVCCTVIGSIKVVQFIRVFGFQLSISQICLLFEIIGSIERFVYLIDPVYTRRIFSFPLGSILVSLSFPLSLASNLMITFYWQEILTFHKFEYITIPKLHRLKWPFVIIVIIMFGLEIGEEIARATFQSGSVSILFNVIAYAIISFAIGLFFIITGIRILRRLRQSTKQTRAFKKINRVSLLMLFCGMFVISFIISLPFIATASSAVGSYVAWWITYGSVQMVCLTQILVFEVPNTTGSSSDSSKHSAQSNPRMTNRSSGEVEVELTVDLP